MFTDAVDLWLELTNVTDDHKQAKLALMLLTGKAFVWFKSRAYVAANLSWNVLKQDLHSSFRPADHNRLARTKLDQCRMTNPGSVNEYIAEFNARLHSCENVSTEEALHRFEQGLHSELAVLTFQHRYATLAEAQSGAQAAGLAWK